MVLALEARTWLLSIWGPSLAQSLRYALATPALRTDLVAGRVDVAFSFLSLVDRVLIAGALLTAAGTECRAIWWVDRCPALRFLTLLVSNAPLLCSARLREEC